MTDPTQRFFSCVANYVKYRPSYPLAIIDLLAVECGLTPDRSFDSHQRFDLEGV